MIKYVWHVASLMIVFCWIQHSTARSATAGTYQQHINGFSGISKEPTVAAAATSSSSNGGGSTNSNNNPSGIWKDMSLVYRIYQQCLGEQMSVCLKVKLLTGLEKYLRSAKSMKIIDGIQFVNNGAPADEQTQQQHKVWLPTNEKEIEAVLPRGADAKEQVLNSMILKRLGSFLQDHTLQIKFPDLRSDEQINGNSVESRKKKEKKGNGAMIMIPLLLGGTFVPIAYGALAMLAGKALIVSKLALVLASIIGIKKLLSGGGGKESSHEVVVSSGSHSGWGRDMDLAYSGWKPAAKDGHSKSF